MRALSDHCRRMLLLGAAAGLLVSCVTPLLAESREEWQQPSRVMSDLALKPDDTIADVGCGEGYFTFRLAATVGDKGKVLAVDISAAALKAVRERAEREKRANSEVIQSEPTDTKLGKESVGAVFLCDVIHEVPEVHRAALMKSIAAALKPGGFFYFIDYRKSRDVTFDPYERLIPHDDLVKYGTDAGLVLDAEFHYLKYQVFLRFRKPPSKEAAASGNASSVVFDAHDGYFVSNKFEPQAPASFVVLRDQKAFDEVFGVAFVMHDKSHRLPPRAFESLMVVAPIKRGKAFWGYTVESVWVARGVLTLRYTTTASPSDTAEYACPLIVSVPKGDYTAVEFVEDGKVVKKIHLAAPPAPSRGNHTSMKGWELYVWQAKGETFFSLLEGTNRLKTEDEVTKAAVKGVDAIKGRLAELKAGETVSIVGRHLEEKPPADQANDLAEYCKKISLQAQR